MAEAKAGGRWDPSQYGRFGDHRLRPVLELLQRVEHPGPRRIVDMGCGRGETARLMAERWPEARVFGLDSSADMLAAAAATPSPVEWQVADVRDWNPEAPVDVLYANAVYQWIDDHAGLFPRLIGTLAPGGVFAAQMPLSWTQASHRLMREILGDGGFGTPELRAALGRRWVEDAEWYYDLLRPCVAELDIWQTEYLQVLSGDDPVLEWVKGTGLRPVVEGLVPDELARFIERYAAALRAAYPTRPGGETLYPFGRLFIVARR
jgi:trans-aconitate 2-methyltransferase